MIYLCLQHCLEQPCQGREDYSFSPVSSLSAELINKVNSVLFTLHFMWFCAAEWARTIVILTGSWAWCSSGLRSQYYTPSVKRLHIFLGEVTHCTCYPSTVQPPTPLYMGLFWGAFWQQCGINPGFVSGSLCTTWILNIWIMLACCEISLNLQTLIHLAFSQKEIWYDLKDPFCLL